jgi:hypothetical protein
MLLALVFALFAIRTMLLAVCITSNYNLMASRRFPTMVGRGASCRTGDWQYTRLQSPLAWRNNRQGG